MAIFLTARRARWRRFTLRNQALALENRGFAAVPDDRLIGNDDSRAGLQGVVNLLSKLRVDAEARPISDSGLVWWT